jgi:predicted nucleotidyltransferase
MMSPEKLAEELNSHLGDNLLSVVLYGSQAAEDATKNYSDSNILVLARQWNFQTIKSVLATVRLWKSYGNSAPLFFTEDRLKRSADVFPIEFWDMKETHKILKGKDPFQDLHIKKEDLRRQLEFELRAKFIQLQQRFMEIQGDRKAVQELLARSLSSFAVLFRSILRLMDEVPPQKKSELWTALHRHAQIDVQALNLIFGIRQKDKQALLWNVEDLMERLMHTVQLTIDFVDNYISHKREVL